LSGFIHYLYLLILLFCLFSKYTSDWFSNQSDVKVLFIFVPLVYQRLNYNVLTVVRSYGIFPYAPVNSK